MNHSKFCFLLILHLNVSITLFITLFITSQPPISNLPGPPLTGTSVHQETRTDHREEAFFVPYPYYPALSRPSFIVGSLRGNVVSSFNHHEAICSSIIPFRRIGGSLFARFYRTCKCSSQQRISPMHHFCCAQWIVVSCHKLAFCHSYMKRSSREYQTFPL